MPGYRAFVRMDLLGDALRRVDLVFCRDCLVHHSSADVRRALRNIVASGSRYLLTSHFADRRKNAEILTGEWRPLNLTRAPFGLPPPDRVILEGCTEEGGRYADKALALWRVEDVRRAMEA